MGCLGLVVSCSGGGWSCFPVQPFGKALGEDLKLQIVWMGSRGKSLCSVGAVKVAGTSCCVLSPALSPEKGSKPETATVTGEQHVPLLGTWLLFPAGFHPAVHPWGSAAPARVLSLV